MTRAATDHERADHDRDLRKHEPLPLRLQPVVPTAMEVALLVKGLANVTAAAGLIEQYAQSVAQAALLDRRVSR